MKEVSRRGGIDNDLKAISSNSRQTVRDYDRCVKNLLSHNQILAYIMYRYIDEFSNLSYQQAYDWLDSLGHGLKSMTESFVTLFKGVKFDIFFSLMTMLSSMLYINIEIQRYYTTYPIMYRAMYYVAYMIVRQYEYLKDFDYGKLCRC